MSNLYASPFLLSHSRSSARDEQRNPFASFQFPGDHTARVTPVPIPNTVVKPRRADDTARATVWERRSSPGLNYKKGRSDYSDRPFCFGVPSIRTAGCGPACPVVCQGRVGDHSPYADYHLSTSPERQIECEGAQTPV